MNGRKNNHYWYGGFHFMESLFIRTSCLFELQQPSQAHLHRTPPHSRINISVYKNEICLLCYKFFLKNGYQHHAVCPVRQQCSCYVHGADGMGQQQTQSQFGSTNKSHRAYISPGSEANGALRLHLGSQYTLT